VAFHFLEIMTFIDIDVEICTLRNTLHNMKYRICREAIVMYDLLSFPGFKRLRSNIRLLALLLISCLKTLENGNILLLPNVHVYLLAYLLDKQTITCSTCLILHRNIYLL
jgi:hypothetical protein